MVSIILLYRIHKAVDDKAYMWPDLRKGVLYTHLI